jgi:sec-independent protein translocase protein TatC
MSEPIDLETSGTQMTLLEHMLALKDHLVRIAIALIVTSAGAFVLSTRIFEWLLVPIAGHEDKVRITANTPTSAISTYVKVAFFSGAILAMPFIVYQILLYVLPALTRKEKRALFWVIPGATFFFLGGAAFAYFVMLPPSLSFLFRFWSEYIDQLWTIEEYLTFVTGLVFWVGVSFETPLLMAFIARMGVVTSRQMLSVWQFALVAIAVIAALITPTADPLNMSLVMGPLVALYFLGILLAQIVQPRSLPRKDLRDLRERLNA